jgi:hypothetical protein
MEIVKMNERMFQDADSRPTEKSLKAVFGEVYPFYESLMEITSSFSAEWKHSKNGWTLKVYDKNKALFYLIPFENEFILSLTIRENERISFLEDGELNMLHEMIDNAKKYSEGFALRFTVNDPQSFEISSLFIGKLILMR